MFFPSFSSPDFAKISGAVLRIFLVRSRALETKIWQISSHVSVLFCFCLCDPKHMKIQLTLFFKEQVLKPCSDCRSRRELSIGGRISYLSTTKSDRLGVKTMSRLSPKALTRRIPSKEHVFPSGNHRLEERSLKNLVPFLFL